MAIAGPHPEPPSRDQVPASADDRLPYDGQVLALRPDLQASQYGRVSLASPSRSIDSPDPDTTPTRAPAPNGCASTQHVTSGATSRGSASNRSEASSPLTQPRLPRGFQGRGGTTFWRLPPAHRGPHPVASSTARGLRQREGPAWVRVALWDCGRRLGFPGRRTHPPPPRTLASAR